MNIDSLLKAKGAVLKDSGTMADLSKKLMLYLNEPNDDQIVNINRLVQGRSVDVIIMPAGLLEDVEILITQALELSQEKTPNDLVSDTVTITGEVIPFAEVGDKLEF